MNREVMKQTIITIIAEAKNDIVSIEDASEAVVKVFEKSLEESISAATKMVPGFGKLFEGLGRKRK